jgi:hypothetical protein
MTEADLFLMLRARFVPDEYALIPRVPDATAGQKSRTADAVAMCLWPSRGLELHGFELKSSRADWLVERKNPAKAEAMARWCDRWWLVVSDDAHVHPGELPSTWGLLAVKAGKLKVMHSAPKLGGAIPDHLRPFVAGLLRAAQDASPLDEQLKAARLEGHRIGDKGANERAQRDIRKLRDELEALQRNLAEFEAASGIHISRYNAGKLGEAVKFVLAGGLVGNRAELLRQQATSHKITNGIDRLMAQIDLIDQAQEEKTPWPV